MKKRKSRDIVLIVIVMASICIFALKSMGIFSAQPAEGKNSSLVTSEDMPEIEETNTDITMEVPSVWKEKIDEYNSIDAVVNIPDDIRKNGFQKATATLVDIKEKNVLTLLEDYYHPYKESEDEELILYRGADELYFYYSKIKDGGISVSSKLREYIYMAYEENMGTEYYNRDKYSTEEELENFPLKECREKLEEICEKVGIEGDTYIVNRALDYRIMQEEAVELHMDGTDTIPDYDWSLSDNCYHCTIFQLCNGIQVIPSHALRSSNDIFNLGSNICVINKERIVNMYIDKVYKISYEAENEKLMEFSDILDIYRKNAGLMLQDYSTKITTIDMRVIPIEEENGTYHMIPIWIFYGTISSELEGEIITGTHVVCINAITGEEL